MLIIRTQKGLPPPTPLRVPVIRFRLEGIDSIGFLA